MTWRPPSEVKIEAALRERRTRIRRLPGLGVHLLPHERRDSDVARATAAATISLLRMLPPGERDLEAANAFMRRLRRHDPALADLAHRWASRAVRCSERCRVFFGRARRRSPSRARGEGGGA